VISARKEVDVRITEADPPDSEAGCTPQAVMAIAMIVRITIKRYMFLYS